MSTGASDAVAFLGGQGSPTLAPDMQPGAEAVARAEGKAQADAEPLEEWRRLDAATTERDRIAELLKTAHKEWNSAKAEYDLAKERLKDPEAQDPDIMAKTMKELDARNKALEGPAPPDAWMEGAKKLLGTKSEPAPAAASSHETPGAGGGEPSEPKPAESQNKEFDAKFATLIAEMAKISAAVQQGKEDMKELKDGMDWYGESWAPQSWAQQAAPPAASSENVVKAPAPIDRKVIDKPTKYAGDIKVYVVWQESFKNYLRTYDSRWVPLLENIEKCGEHPIWTKEIDLMTPLPEKHIREDDIFQKAGILQYTKEFKEQTEPLSRQSNGKRRAQILGCLAPLPSLRHKSRRLSRRASKAT